MNPTPATNAKSNSEVATLQPQTATHTTVTNALNMPTSASAPITAQAPAASPNATPAAGAGANPSLPNDPNAAPGTATGTGTAATKKTMAETIEETQPDTNIVTMVRGVEEAHKKIASYTVDLAEYVRKNDISRPVLIKSIMIARSIGRDSAEPIAARVAKLAKDPDMIERIRRGEVTVRSALNTPSKAGAGSRSQGEGGQAGEGGDASEGAGGAKQGESKMEAYNRSMASFVKAAKGTGLDRASILKSVEAGLKAADVK